MKATWLDTDPQQQRVINEDAPRYRELAPKRRHKALYIQPKYSRAFDTVVRQQKEIGGLKGSELAEEAVRLLCEKYGVPIQ